MCMNTKPYVIEIDAQEAFMKFGVDLRINPIADKCVESLRRLLESCITNGLLVDALGDAARVGKPRRGPKKSGKAGESQQEGRTDEV